MYSQESELISLKSEKLAAGYPSTRGAMVQGLLSILGDERGSSDAKAMLAVSGALIVLFGVIGVGRHIKIKDQERDTQISAIHAEGGWRVDTENCPEWTEVIGSWDPWLHNPLTTEPTFDFDVLSDIEQETKKLKVGGIPAEYPTDREQVTEIAECVYQKAGQELSENELSQILAEADVEDFSDNPSRKAKITFPAIGSMKEEIEGRIDDLKLRLATTFTVVSAARIWRRKSMRSKKRRLAELGTGIAEVGLSATGWAPAAVGIGGELTLSAVRKMNLLVKNWEEARKQKLAARAAKRDSN